MARDWKIQYCPKCGSINMLNFEWEKDCEYCGYQLKDTEYYFSEVVERGKIKPEIQKDVFEKYIKNNPMYSEDAATKRKNTSNSSHIPSSYNPKESNAVTCPYCKSTNVTKISTAGRAVSVGLFGLGSSKVGKQWHCKNCKSDF